VGEPTVPRVSDRDREAAVELLKDHAVAGRVTLAELARRTEPAERAETARGLEALTSDLPVERPAPRPRVAEPRSSRSSVTSAAEGRGESRASFR
jgi:hypothetical protein